VTAAGGGGSRPPLPDVPLTLRRELARKALHVTSAVVPVAYATGVPRAVLLPLLLALVAVAAAVELARRRSDRARERFLRATGLLLRAHEHQRLSGATWLLVSFALAVALYPRAVAVAAMWGVAIGDASAAVVGRVAALRRARRARRAVTAHRGATPHHTSDAPTASVVTPPVTPAAPAGVTARKTLVGSAACFVATLAGALAVARLGPGESVLAALAGALAERPARPFDDKVRIVAAVGAAVLLYRLIISAATP